MAECNEERWYGLQRWIGISYQRLGHELKGLMCYHNAKVEGLHVPLMALIDYRGIRLLAVSMYALLSALAFSLD